MALQENNITTDLVGTTLGNASRNVGVLCTAPTINKWSRYKPGYFTVDGSADKFIYYQAPQGAGFDDPRGVNPETGTLEEGYRLGDFRGYKHDAEAPYADFIDTVHQFPFGTGTATGISRVIYLKDINWVLDEDITFRGLNDWGATPITHVHFLDGDTDTIVGTMAIEDLDIEASVSVGSFSIPEGIQVDKEFHVAFGTAADHWNFKLGNYQGAVGIGIVSAIQLEQRLINAVQYDDSNITGGDNPPYTSMSNDDPSNDPYPSSHIFEGTNKITWSWSPATDPFRANGSVTDWYKNINADWYLKGFNGQASTEYLIKSSSAFSSGSSFTLLTGQSYPSTFGDGDKIILVLKNITINY